MKKFIISLIIIVIVLVSGLIFIGFNPFLPIYQRTDINGVQDQDGISLIIDGVRYKMFPATKWNITSYGDKIGYAGSWLTTVCQFVDDPERNFVFLHEFGTDMNSIPLYRTDKDVPEPCAESIDELVFHDDLAWSDYNRYSNIVEDKDIIKELFDALNTGRKVEELRPFDGSITIRSKEHNIDIYCHSSALPFASYGLHFGLYDGKIICSDYEELFVEVPKELLEKIAGKELDVEGYKP